MNLGSSQYGFAGGKKRLQRTVYESGEDGDDPDCGTSERLHARMVAICNLLFAPSFTSRRTDVSTRCDGTVTIRQVFFRVESDYRHGIEQTGQLVLQ